jgi:hypothetical protein
MVYFVQRFTKKVAITLTENSPKITSLIPTVLPDNRRIMFEMTVEGLPTTSSNVALMMPDLAEHRPPQPPPKPNSDSPSPFPNIQLSVLNSQNQQVATLFIVEHKEAFTSLTLHLRAAPVIDELYTAKAEMTYQDEIIDVVEIPFRLNQAD